MSKKSKLKSPWDNIQSAIWMVGIGILFLTGDWWPGILFIVGISILAETIIQVFIPSAVEEEPKAFHSPEPAPELRQAEPTIPPAAPTPIRVEPPAPSYRTDLLPTSCPACGARVRENEVRWHGERQAECAYCASPLIKAAV